MKTILRPAGVLFLMLTVLCGVLYPYAMTGIGQLLFAEQVAGSLLSRDGHPVGSALIGQAFTSAHYFWGRPSATSPMPSNASNSGGSNFGPLNPALMEAVKGRIQALHAADPTNRLPIPVDLVTTSASGIDPEISLAGAYYQAARIAQIRHINIDQVRSLIERNSQSQYMGFFGEPRVNVLRLNLGLDKQIPGKNH